MKTMISTDQVLHQLTARAIIRDWTDGSLDADRTQHEVNNVYDNVFCLYRNAHV